MFGSLGGTVPCSNSAKELYHAPLRPIESPEMPGVCGLLPGGTDIAHADIHDRGGTQAMKDNPFYVPRELKINNNRITTFGSTALKDAFDMVVENSKRYDIIMTI